MRRSLPVLLSFFLLVPAAVAATRTWTGTTSGSWALAANWGGIAPVANDDLVFPAGAGNLTNNNDFLVPAFNSITVTGAGYTLNSTFPTSLGAGGISSSTGAVTINIDFSLGAAQAWTVTGGVLIMNGDLGLSGQTLTLSATTGAGFLNANIVNNGTIIKDGTGDWTMNGANTYTGQIQINAGRLIANTATVFGVADNTLANGTVVNSGGTLVFGPLTYPTELITIDGAGQSGFGVLNAGVGTVLTGTVSVGPGTAMSLGPGQSITFNGILTGTGRFGMGGSGFYRLGNAGNNFSGGVLWGATGSSDSRLVLNTNNSLPDSVALDIPSGGVFDVNGMIETITSIAGAGTIDLGIVVGRLTITGGSTTFGGFITGIGEVTQSGGVLLLTGTSNFGGSYTNNGGITTLNIGALLAAYTQSAGTFGLAGNGIVGAVNINGGTFQAISAGNSGNLAMAAPATFQEIISGTAPTAFGNVHVTGTVNLGGSTLTLTGSGAGVVAGNTFTIIDNDGADPVVGTFNGLANGATIPGGPGGLNYTIAYNGGTGNDVVLTAVAPIADLSVTKTTPTTSFTPGQQVTFTITVTNGGPGPATAVTMTDVLPANTTFVSATPSQGNCTGTTTIVCNLGTLGNAASATVALVVVANGTQSITNTATAAATEVDPVGTNNAGSATISSGIAIPTASEWGLLLLAAGLALLASRKL